ncbi:MAG: TetR/AcrR family transcriptional regulator [Acidimicrobiales bacterium]
MSVPSTPDMRQKLLDAALDMLRRDGAANLTVRNITEHAGCSTTGIYTYFGGKHGLIEAIFLGGFESFDDSLRPHYEADDLLGAGLAYRRWALDNPTHYLVMFGRAVPDYEPSAAAMARANESFDLLVKAVAGRGVDDPLSTAHHIHATVHGYVMLELVGMGPVGRAARDELYEAGLDQVLAGMATPTGG